MDSAEIVKAEVVAFKRGVKAYLNGRPAPIKPGDEDDNSLIFWAWAGHRVAFGLDHMKRNRIAASLGCERD